MLALHRRLLGDGNRIYWRDKDLDRIARRFGVAVREFPVMRDAGGVPAPTESSEVSASTTPKQATFTISTQRVDRLGDTIRGWRLDNYRRNSVVLHQHDARSLPIGRAVKTWLDGNTLKSTVEFANDRFAHRVAKMVGDGVLRAASVGFLPGDNWEFSSDPSRPYGIDFKDVELLEWSIVSVPCNQDCLVAQDGSKSLSEIRRELHELKMLYDPDYAHRVSMAEIDARLSAQEAWLAGVLGRGRNS